MKNKHQPSLPGIVPGKAPTRNKLITISIDAKTLAALEKEKDEKYGGMVAIATLASYAVMKAYTP